MPGTFGCGRGLVACARAHGDDAGRAAPTSVDVLARGPGRCVTAECKLTEREFGWCSRTRIESGRESLCDGTYRHQQERRTRCALTETGVRYWQHLPALFDWPADRDQAPCRFGAICQLARNALAATVTADGQIAPNEGHALLAWRLPGSSVPPPTCRTMWSMCTVNRPGNPGG